MDPLKGRTNVLSVQPREQEVRITVRNASPPVFQVVVPSIIITQKRPKISTNSFPYSAPKAQSGWCGGGCINKVLYICELSTEFRSCVRVEVAVLGSPS